jgi:hypothetical protein
MALQFGSNTGGKDFFAALNARRKFEEEMKQRTPEQKQAVQNYWNQVPSSRSATSLTGELGGALSDIAKGIGLVQGAGEVTPTQIAFEPEKYKNYQQTIATGKGAEYFAPTESRGIVAPITENTIKQYLGITEGAGEVSKAQVEANPEQYKNYKPTAKTGMGSQFYAPKEKTTAQQAAQAFNTAANIAFLMKSPLASNVESPGLRLGLSALEQGTVSAGGGALTRYADTGSLKQAFNPAEVGLDFASGAILDAAIRTPGTIKSVKQGNKALESLSTQIRNQNTTSEVLKSINQSSLPTVAKQEIKNQLGDINAQRARQITQPTPRPAVQPTAQPAIQPTPTRPRVALTEPTPAELNAAFNPPKPTVVSKSVNRAQINEGQKVLNQLVNERAGVIAAERAALAENNQLFQNIKELGGIKSYANKYLAEETRNIPPGIRNNKGMAPDDMAAALRNNYGYNFESDGDLLSAISDYTSNVKPSKAQLLEQAKKELLRGNTPDGEMYLATQQMIKEIQAKPTIQPTAKPVVTAKAAVEAPLVETPAKPTVANVNKIAGPEDFQKEAVRISQEQNIPVKQAAQEIDARLKMVNESTVKGKGQPTAPGEPIEIQGKVLKDPAVKEVLQGVSRGRNAAGVEGSLVAGRIQTEARRLGVDTGSDFVNRYETGQLRTPQELELASIIKQETDKIFAAQQVLDPTIQYRQNYVPHTFAESQDVVADRVRTLQQQTGAANERIFNTYTEANQNLGLTPKFKTIDQMVGDMAGRTAAALENRATIRRGLESGLFSTNQKGGRIDVRGMFDETGNQIYAQKGVADVLNNVTQTGTTGLEKGARAFAKGSEIAQDVMLQGGIPGTPANFFIAGQVVKDTTRNIGKSLLNPVQAVKQEGNLIGDFFRGTKRTQKRFSTGTFKANGQTVKNADFVREMASRGLPMSFETSLIGQGENVYKAFWNKVGNNPTFQRYMPNRTLSTAQEVYAQSVKSLGNQKALDLAADTTKAFLGHVDTIASGRSNLTKDITGAVLFAPKYRESVVTALGNVVKSVTTQIGNKAYAPSRQLLLGMGMTLVAYEMLNRQLNGHSMLDNRQGQELSLQIPYGEKDEKGRQPVANIPFMPGFMTIPRAGFGFAKGILTGDLKSSTAEASKAFSVPIQTAGAVIGNRDYFGRPIYMDQDTAALEGTEPGSAVQNALDIGTYIIGQGTPAWGRGIIDLMKGKPTEQAIATALEAPVRFGKELPPAQKAYFKDREEIYNTLDVNDRAVWDAIYPKIKNSRGEYIAEKSIDYGMTRAANFLNSPAVLAAANEMAKRAKDRGEKVDPFFELDPTQQRIALRMDTLPPKDPNRTVLKRENAWYKDFSIARSAFFDSLPPGDPNKPKGPIEYPEPSDAIKELQDAYYQLKDPKMKRDFMTKNPELGEQFAKEEQYTRAVRALKNLPQYDQYPEPSTEVQALMDAYSALPKGEANGKSRIRSAWIKSHPEEWAKMTEQFNKIAQFNLQQDAQIAAFEGQDLTDKGIKAIASLAGGGGGTKKFGGGGAKTISPVQGAGLRKAVTFKTPKLGRVRTKGISVKPVKIAKPKVSIKRNVL